MCEKDVSLGRLVLVVLLRPSLNSIVTRLAVSAVQLWCQVKRTKEVQYIVTRKHCVVLLHVD